MEQLVSGAFGASRVFSLFAAVAVFGCGESPRSYSPGHVTTTVSVPRSALRVQAGVGWDYPATTRVVSSDGTFRLPIGLRIASVYADLNGNGRLDRFAEPSAPCGYTAAHRWECHLDFTRLLVHRLVRHDVDGSVHDKTMVAAEAFDPATGQRDPQLALCDDQTCAIPTRGPYGGTTPGLVLGLCALDQGVAEVPVTVSMAAAPARTFSVRRPPLLALHVNSVPTAGGGVRVVGRADRAIDRAIVWLGVFNHDQLVQRVWSSEDTGAIRIHSRAVDSIVPAAALAACRKRGTCRLALQVAEVLDRRDVPTVTEFQALFDGAML